MQMSRDMTNQQSDCAPSEECPADWADAYADLSLRWAHSHFVDFVMSGLKFVTIILTTYLLNAV